MGTVVCMSPDLTLSGLWSSAPPSREVLTPLVLAEHPPAVRWLLAHALPLGSPLPTAVHLRMHGEIKLKRWFPFTAEQVIVQGRGMVWEAKVHMSGLPIRGWDRLVDGRGAMRWSLFGLLPVLRAANEDVTRSARGRARAESLWLPSLFADPTLRWRPKEDRRVRVCLPPLDQPGGDPESLELNLGPSGQIRTISVARWGQPEGGTYREEPFGAQVEAEGTFDGLTIPTSLRAGWWPGTPRFEREGEFFRCEVTEARFR